MGHFKHSNIIADLKKLISLLQKYNFESQNFIELFRLNNIVGHAKDIILDYKTDDIVFNITSSGMNAMPTVKKISVTLNTQYTLQSELTNTKDIFQDYSLNIYIKGYNDTNTSPDNFTNSFCWHLDKETNTDGNYIHPYYHFHAGGNNLDGKDIGELLIISSPRIPHPPMDIFISIHFILTNFFYSKDFIKEKEILKDEEYILIIERAKKRILEPYFSTLTGERHNDYTSHNLFP